MWWDLNYMLYMYCLIHLTKNYEISDITIPSNSTTADEKPEVLFVFNVSKVSHLDSGSP